MEQIKSAKVIMGRQLLENERYRLRRLRAEDETWWDSPGRSDWAREQFGETLIEKDGATHPSGAKFDDHMCSICGELPSLDERIIHLDFSFCAEYDCDMNICRRCVTGFQEKLDAK